MHVSSSHLSDFTEFVGKHFRTHDVTGPDRIAGDLEARHIGKVGITHLRYGSRVDIKADPLSGFTLLQIPMRGGSSEPGAGKRDEFSLLNGQILGKARPIDFAMHRNCTLLITRFENHDIETILADLDNDGRADQNMTAMKRCDLSSPAGRALLSQLQWLNFELSSEGSCLSRMEQHCSSVLLANFLMAAVPGLSRQRTRLPTIATLRRVEAFIDANLAEAITVADLARVADVPVRSLFDLFRRYSQETPIELLRKKRLEAVRQMLDMADPDETSVTEAAMACGFVHLGRFAQYYLAEFGEKPSATLLGRRHHS